MNATPYLTKDPLHPLDGGELSITCAYGWRTTPQ